MRHDTSSPIEEATECVIGVGRGAWLSSDLVPS